MFFCCILDVSSGTCLQTTGKKEIFSQFFRVRNLFTSFHFGIQSKQLLLKPIIFTLHYDRMGWDGMAMTYVDWTREHYHGLYDVTQQYGNDDI